ncbi:MAG: hypothetical protein K0R29_528 [Pseudobdellovibrio sp.]|jgi:hypothetical protein|nr:hypothetical protein [Pseudobdellovibrio sp.]
MKMFLVLFSVLTVHVFASAESLENNKKCIIEKLPNTGASILPVEVRQQCARPLKIESDSPRDGEPAENCEPGEGPDRDKDICKVNVSCKGSDEGTYRFSVDAKVKHHTGLAGAAASVSFGILPKCQLSGVAVTELQSQ